MASNLPSLTTLANGQNCLNNSYATRTQNTSVGNGDTMPDRRRHAAEATLDTWTLSICRLVSWGSGGDWLSGGALINSLEANLDALVTDVGFRRSDNFTHVQGGLVAKRARDLIPRRAAGLIASCA